MQLAKAFQHQAYQDTAPTSPYHLLTPQSCPAAGSDEYVRRLRAVGQQYRAAGVAAIYLVHGTFVGADAAGMLGEVGRVLPSACEAIRRVSRQLIEGVTHDTGNYTAGFARELERGINAGDEPRIPVRLFEWSSENNHIGRADATVRLVQELASLKLESGQRVLLWGHSHAGNVFALLTHLLGADHTAKKEFFDAARVYYRWPLLGCVDIPVWRQARRLLFRDPHPLVDRPLDLVTFGTPIRYGWHEQGYDRLLHFVYHRPAKGLPEYRAPYPLSAERVLRAADGDYIQQLGIAGTNIWPSIFSWRAWWAESRLGSLLQRDVAPSSLGERFAAGQRVPESGTTLLVDYGPMSGTVADHHAGHALYTRKQWLLFHAEEVARRFYSAEAKATVGIKAA